MAYTTEAMQSPGHVLTQGSIVPQTEHDQHTHSAPFTAYSRQAELHKASEY